MNESFKNVLICIISIGSSVAFWPISNFPNFCQNKNSLELLNIIFENSSPKGSFGANKKKFEFSLLSPDSRKLLTTALNEMKTLMLFYPSNLIINVAVNRANCNYLDLKLSFDDVSDKYRKVHFSTYFKKFHTFSYLDPSSNHPQYVLRGLIWTECMRYFRNSFLKKDYMNTIGLFKSRLLKLGYKKGFIDKEILSFEQVKNHIRDKGRDKNFIKDQVLVPIVYDKSNANYKQMRLLFKRAREGLLMAKSILLVNQVLPKMKNLISTRRLLHKKLESLKFGD